MVLAIRWHARSRLQGVLVEYSNNGNSIASLRCMVQAQQQLTRDSVTGPGTFNDNDMLTVGCSDHHINEPWTPCT